MALTSETRTVSPAVAKRLALGPHVFIEGNAEAPLHGETLPVLDPATGRSIATAACGDAADVDRAVTAATKAFDPTGEWRRMSPIERGRVLHRIGDAILDHADEFAELEVLDAGKVRGAARMIDVDFAARCFHYFAGWPTKIAGSTVPVSHPGVHVRTEKDPVGVVGAIAAWKRRPACRAD